MRSASTFRRLRRFRQGIARHELKATEKQYFFVTLRRLAAVHERLPESMVIAENIEVEDRILASGGFSDVRCGRYKGHRVAVKALRVTMQDDLEKLRKVSANVIFPATKNAVVTLYPAVLQRSCSLEYAVPSEHLETCGSSWGPGGRSIHYYLGMDEAREYHGVHQKQRG